MSCIRSSSVPLRRRKEKWTALLSNSGNLRTALCSHNISIRTPKKYVGIISCQRLPHCGNSKTRSLRVQCHIIQNPVLSSSPFPQNMNIGVFIPSPWIGFLECKTPLPPFLSAKWSCHFPCSDTHNVLLGDRPWGRNLRGTLFRRISACAPPERIACRSLVRCHRRSCRLEGRQFRSGITTAESMLGFEWDFCDIRMGIYVN